MTGIQSAIQHDQIVDGADQEKMIVDREGDLCFMKGAFDLRFLIRISTASRIADRAAEALKESRRRLNRAQIGTPTWTGRSGKAYISCTTD
jgi:DNA excision repair protein ERCC-6